MRQQVAGRAKRLPQRSRVGLVQRQGRGVAERQQVVQLVQQRLHGRCLRLRVGIGCGTAVGKAVGGSDIEPF